MIDLSNHFIHGRTTFDGVLHIYNTASGVEFNACTSFLSIAMKTIAKQKDEAWVKAIIDDDYDNAIDIKVDSSSREFIVLNCDNREVHNFKILKASEAIESYVDISEISISGEFLDKPKYDKMFLVYGDSTVSGYGNLGKVNDSKTLFDTDGLNGYAFLSSKHFHATLNSVNGSGWGLVFSPWTTPMRRPLLNLFDKVAPLSDLSFDIKSIKPTIALISLGTNDSFYIASSEDGKKDDLVNEFKASYKKLIGLIKDSFGDIPIVMVYGVMRERHNYQVMHDIYLENKEKINLYEALIEGDGQGVSGHPSIGSHKEISKKLIELLKVILGEC